ncbi:MAG: hypothetical protein ACYDBJ_22420 [Aggregatilineales bacterium]
MSNTSGAKASLISSDAGHSDYFYGLGGDERPRDGCTAAAVVVCALSRRMGGTMAVTIAQKF